MTACEGVGTGISALLRPYLLHPKYIYCIFFNPKFKGQLSSVLYYMVYKKIGERTTEKCQNLMLFYFYLPENEIYIRKKSRGKNGEIEKFIIIILQFSTTLDFLVCKIKKSRGNAKLFLLFFTLFLYTPWYPLNKNEIMFKLCKEKQHVIAPARRLKLFYYLMLQATPSSTI